MIAPLSGASKKTFPSTVVSTSDAHTATVLVIEEVYNTESATDPPAACRHAIPHTSGVQPLSTFPPVSRHAVGR